MRRYPLAVLGALLLASPAMAAATRLAAYAACPLQGGLAPLSVDRAAGLPMTRTVETATGGRAVSVTDGYRILLAFPGTRPFVNLKVETSAPERYAADKQAILDQMRHMAGRSPALQPTRLTQDGIERVALDSPALSSGILGFHTWFDDRRAIIVSAYLLNQAPGQRAFATFEQYTALRDRFLRDFTSCMAALGADGTPVAPDGRR